MYDVPWMFGQTKFPFWPGAGAAKHSGFAEHVPAAARIAGQHRHHLDLRRPGDAAALSETPFAPVPSMRKLPSPPTTCSGAPLTNWEMPDICQLPEDRVRNAGLYLGQQPAVGQAEQMAAVVSEDAVGELTNLIE